VSIVSGKPKHLFVVKDGRVGPGGRTVSAEQFTPEQRATVDRVLSFVPRPPGVLVGAYFMDTPWDVRPLVLEKGVMTVARLSDPGLPAPRREGLARVLGALAGVAGVVACGQVVGPNGPQLWVRRRFASSTLGESTSTDALSAIHPLHLARRLIGYIRYLDGLGVVHGHLVPNNVTVEGDAPVLLDFGFAGWTTPSARYRDLAPEIVRGEAPTAASDVYGLAIVLRHTIGSHVSAEQLRFLEGMMADAPGSRPLIGAVEAFFGGHVPATTTPAPREITPPARVGSGRLVAPPTPAPEMREEPRISPPPESPRVESQRPSPPPPVTPESSTVPPQAPSAATKVVEHAGSGLPLLVFCLGVVVVLAALFKFNVIEWGGSSSEPSIPYAVYWGSGQPPMMRQVAEAALRDLDPDAESVIVGDALRGESEASALVRTRLLRVGYNPLWQHELEENDRQTLLGFALLRVLPGEVPLLPDVKTLHPGVLVALAADADIAANFPELSAVSLVDVAQLPAPFGPVFLELIKQKVENLGAPVARAASHLLAGDVSREVFTVFLPEDLPEAELLPRVKVIVGLLAKMPGAERAFVAAVGERSTLGGFIGWFHDDELVGWGKVALKDRLAIIAGLPTATQVTVEQSADLLRFPVEAVRKGAATRLRRDLRERNVMIVDYISRGDAALSREQTVALVAALEVQGDTGPAFIQGWFATDPPSKAVVELLLARSEITEIDGFNVEAARYLKSRPWDFTLDQIEILARHGEPLVRALAYARLDPRDTAQRSILEKAAAVEASPKLKQQVLEKLRVE